METRKEYLQNKAPYNSLCPDLAPAIHRVWSDVGCYIESPDEEIGEKELEFFLETLMKELADRLEDVGYDGISDTLHQWGYIE